MIRTEAEMRQVPGLRLRPTVDGSVEARTLKVAEQQDFLYFHGPGVLGVYYERATAARAAQARRRWRGRLRTEIVRELTGDFDGVIEFRVRTLRDIPGGFFRGRRGFGRVNAAQAS